MRIDLFVVDGQNDFLATGKESWNREGRTAALLVPKADQEALVVADMIKRGKRKSGHVFTYIHESVDSHPVNHISIHKAWKGLDGRSPDPFTTISLEDALSQKWMLRFSGIKLKNDKGQDISPLEYGQYYTGALRRRGRNDLTVWPVHCQIGTWGQCIYPPIQEAFDDWCEATNRWIHYITKGDFPFTEHYSALQADVPYPGVSSTMLNMDMMNDIAKADYSVWVGWAGSHCTGWTGVDYTTCFKEDPPGSGSNPAVRKMIILTDCCAPVGDPPGTTLFTDARAKFLSDMEKRGARLMTSEQFMGMVA